MRAWLVAACAAIVFGTPALAVVLVRWGALLIGEPPPVEGMAVAAFAGGIAGLMLGALLVLHVVSTPEGRR